MSPFLANLLKLEFLKLRHCERSEAMVCKDDVDIAAVDNQYWEQVSCNNLA